jgi:DUF4097 and DUF4098 domain-containing protein YvlB
MSNNRSLAPLVLGLILVLLGGMFLAINVFGVNISWWHAVRFGLPLLLIFVGVAKLVRHFTWSEERLREKTDKASLLGGIFWTSVGVVWLLGALRVIGAFDFLSSYWPGILILFGLGKIIDFYRLPSGIQFRAGEVVGVVFIMMFGLSISWMADLPGLREAAAQMREGEFPLVFPGEPLHKARVESQEETPAAGVVALQIENHSGDVEIENALSNKIDVNLATVASGDREERASELARRVQLSVQREGPLVKISTNRASVTEGDYRVLTHLRLLVPPNVQLQITNDYGQVKVAGMDAAVTVNNSYGPVNLDAIKGAVDVKSRYETVSLINIMGAVTVENRKGRVQLRDIKGDATVTTDYDTVDGERLDGKVEVADKFGEVRLDGVMGPVIIKGPGSGVTVSHVQKTTLIENSHKGVRASNLADSLDLDTEYSKATLSQLQGLVTIRASHSEIELHDAAKGVNVEATSSRVDLARVDGPIKVASSLQRVSVEDFKGSADVQNEYGEIYVQPASPLGGGIRASNRNGDITLLLPKNASCRLSAQAPGGEVVSDFMSEASPEKSQNFEQTIGGGRNEVQLQTTFSKIRIRKSGR